MFDGIADHKDRKTESESELLLVTRPNMTIIHQDL